MGANLAGGKVVGNHIQCPFHNWEYNGNGSCVHIPYTDAPIPEAAKVKAWPCTYTADLCIANDYSAVETYNIIFFYFDAEGRDPTSLPPEIEGFDKMKYRGNYNETVPMHLLVNFLLVSVFYTSGIR